jgi:hypothetical protein
MDFTRHMSRGAIAATIAMVLSSAAFAADYKIIDRIKLPEGAQDYATFDPASGRVYMPRGNFTNVIDVKTKEVSQIPGLGDHIALPVPGTSLIVLTHRQGTIRIWDTKANAEVAAFTGFKNPNSAVYDRASKLVLVFNKEGSSASLLDPVARKVVATIPISGKILEFPATDGTGKVFDNIETTAEIATIDIATRKEIGRYKLEGCEAPSGLAYVPEAKLLISSCRNGIAKVVQADTGKEIASLPIGKGPDAVIYDPARKLAFIPCGVDGVLEVISLADLNKIAVIQHLTTQPASKTGTIDPATGRLYVIASKPAPDAPGPSRPPRLPDSWEVLVIGQ